MATPPSVAWPPCSVARGWVDGQSRARVASKLAPTTDGAAGVASKLAPTGCHCGLLWERACSRRFLSGALPRCADGGLPLSTTEGQQRLAAHVALRATPARAGLGADGAHGSRTRLRRMRRRPASGYSRRRAGAARFRAGHCTALGYSREISWRHGFARPLVDLGGAGFLHGLACYPPLTPGCSLFHFAYSFRTTGGLGLALRHGFAVGRRPAGPAHGACFRSNAWIAPPRPSLRGTLCRTPRRAHCLHHARSPRRLP